MRRREFVWMVAGACVLPEVVLSQQQAATTQNPLPPPPAPVPWTLGLNGKTPLPHTETVDDVAETDATFFSAVQMATLVHLSSILLPPLGDMPGALDAETPQFLDFLIGDSPAPRKGSIPVAWTGWMQSLAAGTVFPLQRPRPSRPALR